MKQYNNEKAIISLTSWKARINTVYKTIANLIVTCPGFHIVLVLSEEEFPKKEAELPINLMSLVKTNQIEIMWIYKNYKSFKKVLFTMRKYKNVPVISADDDCLYQINYAEQLYNHWILEPNIIFHFSPTDGSGYGIIWPPDCFKDIGLKQIDKLYAYDNDDLLYVILANKLGIKRKCLNSKSHVIFHDTIKPLQFAERYKIPDYRQKEHAFFNNNIII